MKKMLCMVLGLVMLLGLLSGCGSLFTSGGEGDKTGGGSTGDIKMTDKYTFTDPADLKFEKRYAMYCDENSKAVSTAASYGVTAMYSVMYADAEDSPVGIYEFMVCDTEDHAKAVIELYTSFGTTLTVAEADPCVLYSFAEADTAEAMLISFQANGVISEATTGAYFEYYKTFNGGTVIE